MKRILYFVSLLSLIVIGVSLFAVASFAADKPILYSESKIYVDNNNGKDANNGLSPATAKKLLSAAVGLLPDGGTVVASGKIAAGTYTVPALGGTLLLTSNDGAVNYKNFNPANNPACAFKMSSGASVTFTSNVIIEDIILFQEASVSNVIYVKNGATLWIGENVSCIGSPNSQEPCYMSIVVEEGASVVVKSGIFQSITGAGTIVIDGATVIEAPVTQADIAAANALYSLEVIADCGDLGAEVTRAEAAQWIESMTGYTGATFSTALVGEGAFLGQFLRALGYTDVADPVAQAYALGLTDHGTAADAFVRKDAYNILAKSLSADTYAGDPVEDLLVENGVASARAIGFAKRIAAGEKITVVCVGDSITEGVGASAASKFSYPAQLQALLGNGFTVVNCGKSGAYVMNLESTYNVKAADRPDLWYPATAKYSTLMATDADVVIVMLGTNDARSMTAPPAEDVFAQDYKQLIADIATLPSHPEIYLSTTIPAVNADLTHQGTYYTLPARIRSIADELKLPLVDTSATLSAYYYAMLPYNDSVHPTDASYPALATNFYNEVFGHAKALPLLADAQDDVVYLASTGSSTGSGASPAEAVDRLAVAVAKLGKNGGTVVVCDAVDVGRSHLAPCGGEVVITSVFDGVDYRATNGAKLNIKGILTLECDLAFEDLNVNVPNSGQSINCGYHDFTVGEGVVCTGANVLAILAGYRIASGAIPAETVSCHGDCTISIAGGTWDYICGGNQRTNSLCPFGGVDKGAKVTVNISGGSFTHVGTLNINTATGQSGVSGEIEMTIAGGSFAGDVCAICRKAANETGTLPATDGKVTLRVTGGEFAGRVALNQSSDSPAVTGTTELVLTAPYVPAVSTADFDIVRMITPASGDVNGDGVLTLGDVLTALRAVLNGEYLADADKNGDAALTLADILAWIKACAE